MNKKLTSLLALLTVGFGFNNSVQAAQGPGVPPGQSVQKSTIPANLPPAVDPALINRLRSNAQGKVSISTQKGTDVASFVRVNKDGDLHPGNSGKTPQGKAIGFFAEYGGLFGIKDAATELAFERSDTDTQGKTHLTYKQQYRGVPVFAAVLKVHLNGKNRLSAVNGVFIPDLDLDVRPHLTAAEAASLALADVLANPPQSAMTDGAPPLSARDLTTLQPILYVYRDGLIQGVKGPNRLVFEIEVGNGSNVREKVYVDAHSGKIVNRITQIHDAKFRRLYEGDTNNQVWQEGDALPGSLATDQQNIVNFSGDAYHFFFNSFGRDSYDGAGAEMRSVNNDPRINCPNATWNGTTTNYCNGTASDDVVAHEWAHAYTEYTHDLIYQWQPGALNEAYSDIWGETVDLLNGAGSDLPAVTRSDNSCSVYTAPIPELTINSPASIAGDYDAGAASFGPPLSNPGITADIVLANDGNGVGSDACSALTGANTSAVNGNIALVDRGNCPFVTKVKNAQLAGAIAVIVADNVSGPVAGMGGSDPTISIPSLRVTLATGNLIKGALGSAVNATLHIVGSAREDSYRWLLSEDATAFGGAIRDMWKPQCKGHPGKVTDSQYFCSTDDSGGVHSNSGVPNHGFALLVDGGTYNGQTIAALGLVKAAHIYWRAQAGYQTPTTDFAGHADALQQSCQDLIGVPLAELRTTIELPLGDSGEVISVDDCAVVDAMIEAVELRAEPVQCNFQPLLQKNPPALCGDVRRPQTLFDENFDNGLAGWTLANQGVGSKWPGLNWAQVSSLPGGRTGFAAFAADPDAGNCSTENISGLMTLESPEITVPDSGAAAHVISFEHYVATEPGYDGGNLKISINGASYVTVPASAYTFNSYNATLFSAAQGNSNPLAGQPAFSGIDGGMVKGSWGRSQIDVTALGVQPGDTVRLRYDFGIDGCGGIDGWYVDDVAVTACHEPPLPTIVLVSCPSYVPFTGAAQTPCTAVVTASGGFSETLSVIYSNNVNAGIATATATFAGNDRYEASTASATFTIDKAEAVVDVSCPMNVTYTGVALTPCSASVTGAGGLNQTLVVSYNGNTNAGTATASASFAGDANHLGGSGSVTFAIDRAPSVTVVTMETGPYSYRGTPYIASAVVSGVGGFAQTVPVTYSGDCTNVTVPSGCSASAIFAGDMNHIGSGDSTSVTITPVPLTVTAQNAVKEFGDPVPPFTYTIDGFVNNETSTVVIGEASCSTTATQFSSPGSYPIVCTQGTLTAQNYTFRFAAGTLTIKTRDALVRYIGETTWVTSGSTSTTAQVTLTASVQDPTGAGLVGAKVDFIDSVTGKALAFGVTVSPVAGAPGTGTANTMVTLSAGQYGAESYVILVKMTGNYDNVDQLVEDKTATLVVARPAATSQTTGGGTFVSLATAAGTYAGNGDDVSFSVGMKYNKKGTNLQGKITLAVPQDDGIIYVTSNAISSMNVGTSTPKTATVYTKATIYKVQQDGSVVSIDGNVTLRLDISDGNPDKVGFTVLSSKDGSLYYSNQWVLDGNAWRTLVEAVKTGIVTVN